MIHASAGQAYASQPPLDDFVDALGWFFLRAGHHGGSFLKENIHNT